MKGLKGILLHVGVICSFVCVIAKILDWYNPFMDFTGHVWFVETVLYAAVIVLAMINKPRRKTL